MVQVEDAEVPLGDVCLPYVTLLHASFCVYGFDYSRSSLSSTLQPGVSNEDVSTTSTGGMSVGCQVLNHGVKVLLLDARHCLEAMQLMHVEGDVGWTQEHILICLIVR